MSFFPLQILNTARYVSVATEMSAEGHVIGGIFYTMYGLTWVFISMWMHMKTNTGSHILKLRKSKNTYGMKYYNCESLPESNIMNEHLCQFSWLPLPCCPRFPLEPILKIVFSIVGIIVHLCFIVKTSPDGKAHVVLISQRFHIWNDDGSLDNNGIKKPYHATVYGAFLLSGIIDILAIFVNLPRQTSPLYLFIAFLIEGILFVFHTQGKDAIDLHLHSVLTVIILACIVFSLVRVIYATNFVINLGLGCSVILLGLWFVQTGYILNSQAYHLISNVNITTISNQTHIGHDEDDHYEKVGGFQWYITACFAWIVISIAASMIIFWVILLCVQSGLQQCHGRLGRFLKLSCNDFHKLIKAGEFVTLLTRARGYKKVVRSADESENLMVSLEMEQTPQSKTAGAKGMNDTLESVNCPTEDEEQLCSC